jgi:hypothetical protein
VNFRSLVSALFARRNPLGSRDLGTFDIDFEQLFPLDAEALAEEGIAEAYAELEPCLISLGIEPEAILEVKDQDAAYYDIEHRGVRYRVFDSKLSEYESWDRATEVLFHIVNLQLEGAAKKLYAMYGGHDLGGIFLTKVEAEVACNSISVEAERPYLPALPEEWQKH